MISLFKYLRTIHPISNDLRDALEDNLHAKEVKKKDFLLRAGQICSNVYFVERGLLRSYYLSGELEISSTFTKENEVCVSFESFSSQQHGIEYIQALETSDVYYLSYPCYQHFLKEFADFHTICRILMERCLCAKGKRLSAMWMQPAEDRYNWLFSQYPDLFQRVPGKDIASYLGITQGMLSTIRSRRK
jgi:CRP/FNR family transcriptional regulator, anaerobic regulatory protein